MTKEKQKEMRLEDLTVHILRDTEESAGLRQYLEDQGATVHVQSDVGLVTALRQTGGDKPHVIVVGEEDASLAYNLSGSWENVRHYWMMIGDPHGEEALNFREWRAEQHGTQVFLEYAGLQLYMQRGSFKEAYAKYADWIETKEGFLTRDEEIGEEQEKFKRTPTPPRGYQTGVNPADAQTTMPGKPSAIAAAPPPIPYDADPQYDLNAPTNVEEPRTDFGGSDEWGVSPDEAAALGVKFP
ncbi:hypothetical protein ACFL0V_00470 [Nanoarchaeota archaeon]